jgi:hypothetical protein
VKGHPCPGFLVVFEFAGEVIPAHLVCGANLVEFRDVAFRYFGEFPGKVFRRFFLSQFRHLLPFLFPLRLRLGIGFLPFLAVLGFDSLGLFTRRL